MSDDHGVMVEKLRGKWQVLSVNASTGHKSLVSEHDTRPEAIDAATEELEEGYEYGIMYIEKEKPTKPTKKESK